ncbi:C-_U-editing enzyme APOBEC-2-like isoform X2 [Brienomyrus brachyistius]|nr:C->U-editing enzyme APOBEC-2-like isoform X2 [Brienomyrus brachyistius]
MASQQATEGSAQDQKEQRDNLHWKKFLSEADFYQEFKNTQLSHKTVLCFGLNTAGNELWDCWGYTFNIPGGDHAEKQVMQALADFLTPHRLCVALRYRLTLYLSYSPCEDCCCELLAFVKSLKVVEVDVMVSRLYCIEQQPVKHRLQQLMASGIRLSVMGRKDFERCLYLFVSPNSRFKPWPELDAMSRRYSMDLHTVLHECDCDWHLEPEHFDNPTALPIPADYAALERSPSSSTTAVCNGRGLRWPNTPQKQSGVSESKRDPKGQPVRRALF